MQSTGDFNALSGDIIVIVFAGFLFENAAEMGGTHINKFCCAGEAESILHRKHRKALEPCGSGAACQKRSRKAAFFDIMEIGDEDAEERN